MLSGTYLQTLPNWTGYATDGALFISAQLSTDAVSSLRQVWVLIRLWKQHSADARTVNTRRVKHFLNKFRRGSNHLGFICAGARNVYGYKRNTWHNFSCLLILTWAPTKNCLLADSFPLGLWRNKLWQWLEKGCRKPALGVSRFKITLLSHQRN